MCVCEREREGETQRQRKRETEARRVCDIKIIWVGRGWTVSKWNILHKWLHWEGSQTGMISSNDFPNTKHNLTSQDILPKHGILY